MSKKKNDRVEFRDNPDNIVTLSIGELNDLIYSASQRAANNATNNLYNGLARAFLDRFDEDNRIFLNELEEMRIRLNSMNTQCNCNCRLKDEAWNRF